MRVESGDIGLVQGHQHLAEMADDVVDLVLVGAAVEAVAGLAAAVHPLDQHRRFAECCRVEFEAVAAADRHRGVLTDGLDEVVFDGAAGVQDGCFLRRVLAQDEGQHLLAVVEPDACVEPVRLS